jgi:hypothetical protein
MFERPKYVRALATTLAVIILMSLTAFASNPVSETSAKSIAPGAVWVLDKTTKLSGLTIPDNSFIIGRNGYSVTMTVNGIEKDIRTGTYKGDIVLTLTEPNLFKYYTLNHHFRQALYLDKTGVVEGKSVLPAAGSYKLSNGVLTGARITSVGENFNGIFVAGGTYTIKDAVIDFTGNGGDDFDGYGAAIMAEGKDTTLILDGARIRTHGAARPTVVATRNSNVIVKNSTLEARNGILPWDYVPNVVLGEMRAVPWMLGLNGNNRATNLLGNHTSATYINTSISDESWGIISADGDDDSQEKVDSSRGAGRLTAVNCKLTNTGGGGYGNYFAASYYGSELNVGDYASIGGATFAASDPETIARLNAEYKWGLTPEELKALPRKATHVKSGRFGVMVQRDTKVMDDTVIDTEKTVFLVKGAGANINVDGSKGAQLNPKNGIILQILENDDPMGMNVIYHEPDDPVKVKDFDVTAVNKSDVMATFSSIALKGDFYNGFPGGVSKNRNVGPEEGGAAAPGGVSIGGDHASGGGPGGSGPDGGGGGPMGNAAGKNLVLKLERANITGLITASRARHAKSIITSEDYKMLGEVTNRPGPAVNNGVILSMDASTWTVTGTSYLTSLTIDEVSVVKAPEGSKVTMTVDGVPTAIKAGSYKGNIVITVTKS